MMFISSNAYLSMDEMKVNAQYLTGRLLTLNWTYESIAGILGNMQVESTINPGIWENLDEGNLSGGYGLVQWTPASKYTNWADSRGLPWGHPDSQIARIMYEVDNNIQWIHPSMTFKQFTDSTLPPYDLAVLFLHHYERPLNPDPENRGTKANFWYEYITGNPPPQPPKEYDFSLILYRPFILRRRNKPL